MIQRNGSIQLFRLFGITVFLHWSWFLLAAYQISERLKNYHWPGWGVMEYLSVFGIVLAHEFGHALACRSVGGRADRIMLWPLGGIAYVNPPMRPGALLWSIVAGPLVNIVLAPATLAFAYWAGQAMPHSDLAHFAIALTYINGILLVFNIMPVYPLDGGQILHALLWFVLGFSRSLRVVSVIGIVGAAGLGYLVYLSGGSAFAYALVLYIAFQAYNGFRIAQYVARQPAGDQDPA